MPKGYDIENTVKDDNGVIIELITTDGITKTKEQVIDDINNGYDVTSSGTEVVQVNNDYVRTIPNGNESDNLSNK